MKTNMKETTFISTAIGFVLVFWAVNATALPGGPEVETVHFDLILGQQGLNGSYSAPNTYVSTINTVRITDKDLLCLRH